MSEQVVEQEGWPEFWQGIPPRVIVHALNFGVIKLGYTLKDYIHEAIENKGYETILNWGVQGSGKSNFTLQQGYWVYGDWDLVLKNLVFKPTEFVKKLKAVPKGKRIPWIGWDDVGVHYASSAWRTNIQSYEAIDAAWASIRTKCSVVSLNIPLIDRLAKNLKDNVTFEVYVGKNQNVLIERYVRLVGLRMLESTFKKVQIEPVHQFNLYDVPQDVFKEYWERRLQLTEEALDELAKATEADRENYVPISEVAKMTGRSLYNLMDMYQRGAIVGKRFGREVWIERKFLDILVKENEKRKKQAVAPQVTS